ncbi:MAG: hypothetical protein CL583_01955 [Alteromonadaceae bacterium]|nr:hypothetical protein [Alteromonadaceae bacterium]|tara:strand:- start:706 stop:999 length:294 start_codon:yes stop_codon:yes gene_type:complete
MTTNLRELCERAAKVFGSPQNHTSDQIASMVDELEAAGRGELCGAPTDNDIEPLDSLCAQYNQGQIDLTGLVCGIWNKAYSEGRSDAAAYLTQGADQ